MIVLGIADNHDSGAAVVIDGQLVSAVNQERIDRVKNSGAFPLGAIDSALDIAGIRHEMSTVSSSVPALRHRPSFVPFPQCTIPGRTKVNSLRFFMPTSSINQESGRSGSTCRKWRHVDVS